MSDKVTVRFESTMDSANSEPLLLSGPIQIFASVDTFEELSDKNLIMAIKDAEDVPQIIVFVNDVGATPNTQAHRGAYFHYIGDRRNKSLVCNIHEDWQEILLGTHSHENMNQLNSLAELPYGEDKKDKLVAVDGEGNFKLVENVELPILPALPPEFVNKIKELEDYRKLNEPEDSEWHHLDAGLNELTDTYDWLRKDKDGNYTNLAIGNCRELYHSLIKSDKPLYLNSNGEFSNTNDASKIALEIYEINFNPLKKEEGYDNVILDSTNSNRSILKVKLPFTTTEDDNIMLFMGDKILSSDLDYEIVHSDINTLTIRFNRRTIEEKVSEFVVLVSRGKLGAIDIRNLFADGKVTIADINKELIKLYIEGEFNRKPYIPQLYLTTDQYGNIHWDNKLLPTQYFYAKSITINNENIKHYFDEKLGKIKLVFEDAFFNLQNGDFPILLADQYFAFDLPYDEKLTRESKKDLIYLLEKDNRYLNWGDDDEIIADATTFTLIIIKNSANGSLADEIAERYISKDDAVKILSHGKITLKEYAKASELIGFSRIGHTHSQYALKDHDHDYRYANYHHTHPELSAILAASTNIDKDLVDEWVNKLTGSVKGLVEKVEQELVDNKRLNLSNLAVTNDIVMTVNKKIEKDGYNLDELKPLNGVVTLDRVVEYLVKFFELEYIYADQVKIPQEIVITNKLKGMTREKYDKDTDIYFILRDILNPLVSAEKIKEKMTPSAEYSYLEFYRIDSTGELVKIEDPKKIKSWITPEGQLLFKVIFRNSKNEECSYISHTGNEISTQPIVYNKYISYEHPGYYVYDYTFDFQEIHEYEEVKIGWNNMNVYDSYGLDFVELNPNDDFITIQPEFDFVYIDYYAGVLDEKTFKEVSYNPTNYLKAYSGDNEIQFKLTEISGPELSIDYVTILASYNGSKEVYYEFLDERGVNIFEFFEEDESNVYYINNNAYICYYYKVLYEPLLENDEKIDHLTITIKKKEV